MSAAILPPPEQQSREKHKAPRKRLLAYFGVNSLALSILIHVLFAVGATLLIVEHFQKKHINFHATEPPAAHNEVEHKIEVTKRNNVESAPPDLKRIVSTDAPPITLPDVPEVPTPAVTDPSPMSGTDGLMGEGLGDGSGGGGGGNGSGSPFGVVTDGPALLEGHLYDLKQTPDRIPTKMKPKGYTLEIQRFISSGWDMSILHKYFESPVTLSSSYIFIPTIKAEDGPVAFGVEKDVQPDMYCMLYHTVATPPQDGTYRFVGTGDDVLAVRVNGQNVLDGSHEPMWPHKDTETIYQEPGYRGTNDRNRRFCEGEPFHVSAGDKVRIDILIGECPGGSSNYFLMIRREESNYSVQSTGAPLLPIFQLDTNPIHPVGVKGSYPPFSPTIEAWRVINDL